MTTTLTPCVPMVTNHQHLSTADFEDSPRRQRLGQTAWRQAGSARHPSAACAVAFPPAAAGIVREAAACFSVADTCSGEAFRIGANAAAQPPPPSRIPHARCLVAQPLIVKLSYQVWSNFPAKAREGTKSLRDELLRNCGGRRGLQQLVDFCE